MAGDLYPGAGYPGEYGTDVVQQPFPAAGSIALSGLAPAIRLSIAVPAGSVTLTGRVISLVDADTVPTGQVALTGQLATFLVVVNRNVGCGAASLTGLAPTMTVGGRAHTDVFLDGLPVNTAMLAAARIRETLGATPNIGRMSFKADPRAGADVRIYRYDASNNRRLLFGGEIQGAEETYDLRLENLRWDAELIDRSFRANERRPFGTFDGVSASDVALALAAYAPDCTTSGIEVSPALPDVSIIFDGSESLMACFQRLALAVGDGCRAVVTYDNDLGLFLTDPAEAPDPIDDDHPPLNNPPIRFSDNLSQLRTRMYGKGYTGTLTSDVDAGEEILPITAADAATFTASGGKAIAGTQAGAAQSEILDYAGVDLGGVGALVGPGAAPSSPPTAALAVGSGIDAGVHSYAYTDVTAAGETIPSPLATVTTGNVTAPLANPTTGPTAPTSPVDGGNGPDPGVHYYAFTCLDAVGETLPSSLGPALTTRDVTPPAPSSYGFENLFTAFAWYSPGDAMDVVVSYVNASGEAVSSLAIGATVPAFPSNPSLAAYYRIDGLTDSSDATVTSKRVYVRINGGTWHWDAVGSGVTTWEANRDHPPTTTGAPPGSNTAYVRQVLLNVPVGPSGTLTRKVYRTAAGGSQLKYVGAIANNSTVTGAFFDNVVDASLGINAPTSNTTSTTVNYSHVDLAGISVGASGTTSRWIYRTAAGGSQLKRLHQLSDNSTTVWTDSAADSTLGANAPTVDTSGLTQGTGQVLAGADQLVTSSSGPFRPGGGWAIIGNGQQYIRYAAISGNTLTGIPATGPGAITAPVGYNTTISSSPCLFGVTGAGSPTAGVSVALLRGSTVAIWVQRDDVIAQGLLGQIERKADGTPGDGIREDHFFDGRLGEAALIAECDAKLASFSRVVVGAKYSTLDEKTHVGGTVPINLTGKPSGDYTIQSVDVSFFGPTNQPRYDVAVASVAFTLADFIQIASIARR